MCIAGYCLNFSFNQGYLYASSIRLFAKGSDLLFIAASFWFEERPCAVQTNTVSLDRLCMLFVSCCRLYCFIEHAYAVLHDGNHEALLRGGLNSPYSDTDRMKNVFFNRFSKPHLDRAKAERWANACSRREGFAVASILKVLRRTPTFVH